VFVRAELATTELIPVRLFALPFRGFRVFLSKLCGKFLDVPGVFLSLLGKFVSRQVIALAVGDGRRRVGVGRKIVQFSESIVWALGHDVLLNMEAFKDS
jgi:hypothetical protein